MRRALLISLSIAVLTAPSAGCAVAGDRVDGLRGAAGGLRGDAGHGTDELGFCQSLTRAAAAIESGAPAIAEEATEEALARAPDDLVDDTRAVAEVVRKVRDEAGWDPSDPQLTDVAERLAATARRTCEPG